LTGPRAAAMGEVATKVARARAITFDGEALRCVDLAGRIAQADGRFNPDTEVALAAPAWLETAPPQEVLTQNEVIARTIRLAHSAALTEGGVLLDAAGEARCSLAGALAWTVALLSGARIHRLSAPASGGVWEEWAAYTAGLVLLEARRAPDLPPAPAGRCRPRVLFARERGLDTGAIASRLGADWLGR